MELNLHPERKIAEIWLTKAKRETEPFKEGYGRLTTSITLKAIPWQYICPVNKVYPI